MIENDFQWENTCRKLERLEKLHQQERETPESRVRDVTLRSLKRMINEFKEEIALFEAHQKTTA